VRTLTSPFQEADAETLKMTEGRIHAQGKSPDTGVTFHNAPDSLSPVQALEGRASAAESRTHNNQNNLGPFFQADIFAFGAHQGSWRVVPSQRGEAQRLQSDYTFRVRFQ
jgi:hypothetical protein